MAVSAAIDGGIQQAMEKTFAVQRRALTGSMHILYWLAKHEIGHFTKFESLRKLCLDLGCEYFSELSVARNVNYTSHRIISEWLEVINDVIERDVLDKVRQCRCIGLMCDESTDISITKELILYCRIVCNREIQTHFLKLVQLPDGKAETIHDAIIAYLQGAGIHLSSITSFGSDGASVMVGSSSGVATRLKQLNPQMLSIHCINHRLALATSQAANSIPYLLRFQEILTSIYKFYHYSAKRQAALAEIQAVLHDPVLKLKEPKAVRWLSHAMAINAVKRSLPALLTSLERESSERSDPTALGLTTLCRTYMFIASIMLLSDVLSHVTKLSLLFQRENIDFAQIQPLVLSCIEGVQQLGENPGPAMRDTDNVIRKLTEDYSIPISGLNDSNKSKFKSDVQQKYCTALVEHLQRRFAEVPILRAFQLFNPSLIPAEKESVHNYGTGFVSELAQHFELDTCSLQQEWASLVLVMDNNFKQKETSDVLNILATNSSYQNLYPLFSKIASIALTLPVTNADSERGFSVMNRVKTILRNRLTVSSLDTLLRISIEGPERTSFDFERTVTLWSSKRNRRIFD